MHTLKIRNEYFFVEDISTQFSIGTHGNLNITINTMKFPSYYKYFIDIFDSYSEFDIQYKNLRGYGCMIKSLDIDNMNYLLYVNIHCDYLEQVTVQEKRDELIDDVLNKKTSNN